MDPITRDMQRCAGEAEAFWRAHPERVWPLLGAEDERSHLVQALRLRERAPDNRRPFVIFEAAFVEATGYFHTLAAQIAAHYQQLREGVGGEGVALPAFVMGDALLHDDTAAMARALHAATHAADLLGEHFAGLVVALVPEHVVDVTTWRESIAALTAVSKSSRLRLAVLAPPGGPLADLLGDEGARFGVDADVLMSAAAGAAMTSDDAPSIARLRGLLLDAADAQRRDHHEEAAACYRRARTLCQAEALPEHEAAVLIAFAGMCLAADAVAPANEALQEAAHLAGQAEAWALSCQAWLGLGGARSMRDEIAEAAAAYRMAAEAAQQAQVTPLRIEALRMLGSCCLRLGHEDGALMAWREALDAAAEDADRDATCFKEVGRLLARLLERRGSGEEAGRGARAQSPEAVWTFRAEGAEHGEDLIERLSHKSGTTTLRRS